MGCKIPFYQPDYGTSTRAILKKLKVKTIEPHFNCCGYPNRDIDFTSFILSSARNMAIAEKKKVSIITPCKCCYGSFLHTIYALKNDKSLLEHINKELSREGLKYTGSLKIMHLLQFLHNVIGVETLKKHIVKSLDLSIAVHYGCHALRPSEITHFDNPYSPSIFENVMNVTGAEIVDWSKRLECCGNPLHGKNNELSLQMTENKLQDAKENSADCIATACTYCQIQFDTVQDDQFSDHIMPSVLFTQLLGYAMGLEEKKLGIENNKTAVVFA